MTEAELEGIAEGLVELAVGPARKGKVGAAVTEALSALTLDEARRIAANIAKLPALLPRK